MKNIAQVEKPWQFSDRWLRVYDRWLRVDSFLLSILKNSGASFSEMSMALLKMVENISNSYHRPARAFELPSSTCVKPPMGFVDSSGFINISGLTGRSSILTFNSERLAIFPQPSILDTHNTDIQFRYVFLLNNFFFV